MEKFLRQKFHFKKSFYIVFPISSLTAFGIYMGRFLRYNSWDILQNPIVLFDDILLIIINPIGHFEAWLFTISFTIFLFIGFLLFKVLKKAN